MSISLHRHRERGSLLLTAAVTAGIIAIIVVGLLTYISNEYCFNLRSHRWNQALNLAEAGVETAFAEFNSYYLTGSNAFADSRGWIQYGNWAWRPEVPFTNTNGEVVGTYWAWVSDIYSANPWLMGQGNCPTTPHGPEVRRRVECYLKNNAQFPAGMVAKRTIDMNGNNVTTDSYDSTDPSKSTNGLYDFAKRQPNGDIASNDTVTNTVDVLLGNADIYGQVMVSPSGSVTMGPNGSIGPTLVEGDRATTVAQALTNGWLRTDFQVDVPDVILPTGAASWPALPASGPITAGDYKSTLINSSRTVTNGTVRIYLTGNSKSIQLTGNDAITIATGAKLILYTDGSVDIAGNGVVNNTGRPLNCQLYARNTTSVKYSGNAAFNGIIYAPKAAMEIKGGGANGEVSGSIVADTIKMTGGTVFHYDEALRKTGPNSLYNIATWRSLRNTGSGWVAD